MAVDSSLLSLQATATSLITKYGNIYKLVRPSVGGDTVLAAQVYGTFDKQVSDWFSSTGGGVISNSNKTILMPIIKFGKVEPQPGDRLLYGNNQSWRIEGVDVVRPDNITTILYTLTVS